MKARSGLTVDLHWVAPRLAVGGRYQPRAVSLLAKQHQIRWVIDLREEDADDPQLLSKHGIGLLHLPTPDTEAVSQEMLSQGVAWARRAIDRDERVLVHCEHGIGRSALIACCILVSMGHTPVKAIRAAKDARSKVSPSPRQLEALLAWSRDWHRLCQTPFPPTTWDELAAIAYEHLRTTTSSSAEPESR